MNNKFLNNDNIQWKMLGNKQEFQIKNTHPHHNNKKQYQGQWKNNRILCQNQSKDNKRKFNNWYRKTILTQTRWWENMV